MVLIIIPLWGITIMSFVSRKEKNKRFHDATCRKELRLLTKSNKKKRVKKHQDSVQPKSYSASFDGKNRTFQLKAPCNLCVFDSTQDAVEYFNAVMRAVKECQFGDSLFFDLSDVKVISPDAIMYLIAVIKNTRRIRGLKIQCKGNIPKESSAREIIERSGFFEFVSSTTQRQVKADGKYMKISDGKNVDGELGSSFCDFVQRACNTTHVGTKRLYTTIIELMTNTQQHAYELEEHQSMMGNWYLFAQDIGNAIHFVFLDTGVGIPKTVSKRFWEIIKDFVTRNDATYLKSALQGKFRSETKQEHRGKGLPGIYEDARCHSINNLSIISGQGKCSVREDSTIETECLNQTFEGTLLSWDIVY